MATERQRIANRANRAKRPPLSQEARARLREAALRNKPWRHATGPRTAAGKARSSQNAVRTGADTAARRAWRARALLFLRQATLLRGGLCCRKVIGDPDAFVAELKRLSEWLLDRR